MRIRGIDYTIKVVDTDDFAGKVDYWNQTILIAKAKPEFMKQSLFHEITHAILVNNGDLDVSDDEKFVQRVGGAVFELIKDNPDVYAELEEAMEKGDG